MRILNFHEMYSATYGGGAAAYVRDTCRLLAQRGHEVSVVVPSSAVRDYDITERSESGVRIFEVGLRWFQEVDPEGWSLSMLEYSTHERRLWDSLQEILDRTNPEIAVMHFARPFGESFLTNLRKRGLPVAYMLHDAWAICLRYQLIRAPHDRPCEGPSVARCTICIYANHAEPLAMSLALLPARFLRRGPLRFIRLLKRRDMSGRATSFIAPSEHMRRTLAQVHPTNTVHIPLGIDLEGLPPRGEDRPRRPFRFGFVGGFQPHKGVWDVMAVARQLKEAGRTFELHIWGPDQGEGLRLIEEMKLDGVVRLRGVYPLAQRWEAYREMDALVMATTHVEPFGRVIGEAAGSGVPSIAPDIGGITEQIRSGIDGLLFRFRDRDSLKDCMERFLGEPFYRTLLSNLQSPLDTRIAIVNYENHLRQLSQHTNG